MGADNSTLNFSYNENSRIGFLAKTLIETYKNNIQDDGIAEILVPLDILNLDDREIKILEGIIMASGYNYYEVSDAADTALIASLHSTDAADTALIASLRIP